ncbi:MAG: DISARM system phospholipase D-like protein DrmC [Verrucomicrobiia bacterium]
MEITSPTIEKFCDELESLPVQFKPDDLPPLTDGFNQPDVRNALAALVQEWQRKTPDLTPRELAWAIRAANATDDFHRSRQGLELVWTGPTPGTSTFRRTDQALLEIIRGAKKSIIIVTFAAYKVPAISAALVEAAQRGVEIILILESVEESEGKVTANAIKGLGEDIAGRAKVYLWPLNKRGVDAAGRHGSLHVKCAVADDEAALISSANLTEYAMNLNMELGLMARGGDLPRSLAQHLRSLIQSRVLARCKVA